MTTRRHALLAAASLPAVASAAKPEGWPAPDEINRRISEVTATEIAFAARMAHRDAAGFRRFLAADTIFVNGRNPLHGPDAVMEKWQRFFEGPQPPFAWAPDLVVVLPSGDLAQSSGPVTDPDGKVVARFQSVWRRKPAGGWEIVFDQGSDVCR
ncbi:nuclear transport factor 2 family protein [Roseateles sp.]|uniref:YybH family protein n=1 Tax=Roseateles sp. TaxID=1971397 RepID=UPI002DFAC70E|nr:nuclear transport factor 2 family protein [Roseateles sp.]